MRCTQADATGMLPSLASTRTPACGMVGGGWATAQIGNIHLISKSRFAALIKMASRIYDFALSGKSKLVRRFRFLSQVAAASSPKGICNFGQSCNSQLQR